MSIFINIGLPFDWADDLQDSEMYGDAPYFMFFYVHINPNQIEDMIPNSSHIDHILTFIPRKITMYFYNIILFINYPFRICCLFINVNE